MSFEACFWVELFSLPFPRFFVPLGFGFCCGLFFWLGVSGFGVCGVSPFCVDFLCVVVLAVMAWGLYLISFRSQ